MNGSKPSRVIIGKLNRTSSTNILSGTYNNQWTVVDYKLFTPGQELPNTDVLWILEQVP